jgi:hypothetical protein
MVGTVAGCSGHHPNPRTAGSPHRRQPRRHWPAGG